MQDYQTGTTGFCGTKVQQCQLRWILLVEGFMCQIRHKAVIVNILTITNDKRHENLQSHNLDLQLHSAAVQLIV